MMVCGVRTFNGKGYVDSDRGAPCKHTARYSGTFERMVAGIDPSPSGDSAVAQARSVIVIGLCEEHAMEAWLERTADSGVPVRVVELRSLPREVFEANQLRARFLELVS